MKCLSFLSHLVHSLLLRLLCLHELVLNSLCLLMEPTHCTLISFSPLVQDGDFPFHAYTRIPFIFLFLISKFKPISSFLMDMYLCNRGEVGAAWTTKHPAKRSSTKANQWQFMKLRCLEAGELSQNFWMVSVYKEVLSILPAIWILICREVTSLD